MNLFFVSFLTVFLTVISDLWGGLTTVLSEVGSFFVALFETATKIFYDASATGDKITFIGWLTLSAMGVGLFLLGLRWIRSLIYRMKGR